MRNNDLMPSIRAKSYIKKQMEEVLTVGLPKGLYTGEQNLDDLVRLDLGMFAVVTGYANVGKSELIDWLCVSYNLNYKYTTLFYSPENSIQSHITKLTSKLMGKSYDDLSIDERNQALEYVCSNFYFYDTSSDKFIEDVLTDMEKHVLELGTKVVVLEPFNSFSTQLSGGNLYELNAIRSILTKLRDFAIQHNVLVILAAHPKKPNDLKSLTPTAYDISGSADFKNRADVVLVIDRRQNDQQSKVTISADKVRDKNYGRVGECNLKYDYASGNYYHFEKLKNNPYVHRSIELPELTSKTDVLDVNVSLYEGVFDGKGIGIVNLKDWLMSKSHYEIVNKVRQGATPQERHDIKMEIRDQIPCVTVSGVFSNRDSEHIMQHTGLLAIDIDNVKSNYKIMPQVPEILKQFDFIAYVGKSISGDGYFAILPIEQPKHHLQHFYAIEAILKDKGITIDAHCTDVTRLRLASYDEGIYYNPNATTFYYELDVRCIPEPTTKKGKKNYEASTTQTDQEILDKGLEYLKNNDVAIADDYEHWFDLGMSLSALGEEKGRYYFHQFSSLSNKYDEVECNKQFDEIISRYGENNKFTLATAVDMIKEIVSNNSKANS